MTSPGARGAQQAYQQQVRQNSAAFHRNTAHRPRGPVGLIGRAFGLVFSLVFVAVVIGIFLTVLGAVEPHWLSHVKTWFDRMF
jgi:hypothetical protein